MRHLIFILFLLPAVSWATGKEPVRGTTNMTTEAVSGSKSKAVTGPVKSSSAATAAGGQGGSSSAQAAGGQGGSSSSTTGPVSVESTDSSSTSAWAVGLPPPVSGGDAAVSGCVVAGNVARALGWNFASKSDVAALEPRHCTMLLAARDAHARCHFLSAATLTTKVASELSGVTLSAPPGERDLTAAECHMLRNPPPPPPPAPAPQPEPPKAPERITLKADTLFDFDKATLKPAGERVLSELAPRLRGAEAVLVTGHTDWVGSDAYNDRLSLRRADAVAGFLVLNGVPRSLITTAGRGEREPVADNRTDEGRALNRRVELRVTGAKP